MTIKGKTKIMAILTVAIALVLLFVLFIGNFTQKNTINAGATTLNDDENEITLFHIKFDYMSYLNAGGTPIEEQGDQVLIYGDNNAFQIYITPTNEEGNVGTIPNIYLWVPGGGTAYKLYIGGSAWYSKYDERYWDAYDLGYNEKNCGANTYGYITYNDDSSFTYNIEKIWYPYSDNYDIYNTEVQWGDKPTFINSIQNYYVTSDGEIRTYYSSMNLSQCLQLPWYTAYKDGSQTDSIVFNTLFMIRNVSEDEIYSGSITLGDYWTDETREFLQIEYNSTNYPVEYEGEEEKNSTADSTATGATLVGINQDLIDETTETDFEDYTYVINTTYRGTFELYIFDNTTASYTIKDCYGIYITQGSTSMEYIINAVDYNDNSTLYPLLYLTTDSNYIAPNLIKEYDENLAMIMVYNPMQTQLSADGSSSTILPEPWLEVLGYTVTINIAEEWIANKINGTNGDTASYYNSEGYNRGWKVGYNSGYDAGYAVGYDDGTEANSFNFLSLISAVVEAPVTVLKSMLNFEILGVNMYSLMTGLITIALIFALIKFFVGI